MAYVKLRNFQEMKWDDPLIFELSEPGSRSIVLPLPGEDVKAITGDMENLIPLSLKRKDKPGLPELSQPQVLRHYMRLSQETMQQDTIIDLGLGTCTMKYSPKINEQFVQNPKFADLHPYQDEDTIQGMLQILYEFEQMINEISGLDAASFQPGGGSMGIYANASVVKKYFEDRNEPQRTQVITTDLSHPINAGAPHTKGFEVINLVPDEFGRYSVDQLKEVVSEKTAALFITDPEETGIFNPLIKDFVKIIHDAGGLVVIDFADYNGMFGIVRGKEIGADLCQFNLHKSFASPHGCQGPASAAQCCTAELEKYLPRPRVRFNGEKYYLDFDGEEVTIGRVRQYYGVISAVVRAYAWVLALGAEGIKKVAQISILNNHYMMKKLVEEVPGLSLPWNAPEFGRLEQCRYSFEKLYEDTGIRAEDLERRMLDFGFGRFFLTHENYLIPEPFTPEPNESYSKDDLDEYTLALKTVAQEAYTNPEMIRTAPHKATISRLPKEDCEKPSELITTYRALRKKEHNEKEDWIDR